MVSTSQKPSLINIQISLINIQNLMNLVINLVPTKLKRSRIKQANRNTTTTRLLLKNSHIMQKLLRAILWVRFQVVHRLMIAVTFQLQPC